MEAEECGQLLLGGYIVSFDSPDLACRGCAYSWRSRVGKKPDRP